MTLKLLFDLVMTGVIIIVSILLAYQLIQLENKTH